MSKGEYRPVKSVCLGLIIVGGVVLCVGLFLMLAGMNPTMMTVWLTLAVGTGLVVLGLLADFRGLLLVFSNRQAGVGLVSLITILLATIILILVNFVAGRHGMKFDWTEKHLWTLSDRVRTLLTDLDKDISATMVFYPRQYSRELRNLDYDGAERGKRLLGQFADASHRFTFEYVGLDRAPKKWEPVKEKFKLKFEDLPCVVFTSGDRSEVVTFDSIYKANAPSGAQTTQPRFSYMGESRFASVVLMLQGRQMPKLYFTTGHGEPALDRELADLVRQLHDNYLEVKTCPNLTREPVPEDCAALLIIGPKQLFRADEVARIADYLEGRKGAVYLGVAYGVETGLNDLLGGYGIVLDSDMIIDETPFGKTATIAANLNVWHPVTKSLRGLFVGFDRARSIDVVALPPGPTGVAPPGAETILSTGKNAYGERDLKALIQDGVSQFDPGQDIRREGGLAVAVAYETRAPRSPYGPPPPEEKGPRTRLIVVGSATHMLNAGVYGNVAFFLEAVKWLAQTEDPIQVKPVDLDFRPLDELPKDPNVLTALFPVMIFAVPVLLLVCGCVVWLFRRT